jgi:hypothetical protein
MLWLRCLLMGHDDTVAREPGRMWLRCLDCGRDTPGWRVEVWGSRPVFRDRRSS